MRSSTRLCIAGKNQVAVDILDQALALPELEITVLPVADDCGSDGWQPSLRCAARCAGVKIVTLDWAMEQPDITFLSLEYDRLIAPARFQSKRLFNIHFSLLPHYRGCFTGIWPILDGQVEHGVTLHWIDAGMDTGPIIDQSSFALDEMTARQAYFRCMDLGRDLVAAWLERLLTGNPPAIAQDHEVATSFRRKDLDFRLAEIGTDSTVEQTLRRIRAFTFAEYQMPTLNGRPIISATRVNEAGSGPSAAMDQLTGPVSRLSLSDGMIDVRISEDEAVISHPNFERDFRSTSRLLGRRA